jgi:Mg2+ and Co2+ transporter CorA|tara:strand:- start:1248 stop:1427 length:180 start_codon:yes stop_codon:yes gene_type:complete
MAFEKENTKGEVTPEYVNKKMESMMAALFDTIEDFEDRVKVLEKQVYELKQERNGKVQE